eukprot:COSAG01_NODE_13454_length_1583_cov_2.023585_1_plen_161_part_00
MRHECLGEHRCPHCCDTFPSALELKAHCKSRICPRILNRDRKSATVKDVHYFWRKAVDQTEPVLMDGDAIKQVYEFKYLGFLFTADNDQLPNVEQRIGRADTTFKSLRHIWSSKDLSDSLKRRIYTGSVISVLTYGHETWRLTTDHAESRNQQISAVLTL